MMTDTTDQLTFEPVALKKYEDMIARIPLFHRDIAKQVVDRKSALLARERGSAIIGECDIVRAFFSEVPMAFYSLMIRLFDEVGFDYQKYEPR